MLGLNVRTRLQRAYDFILRTMFDAQMKKNRRLEMWCDPSSTHRPRGQPIGLPETLPFCRHRSNQVQSRCLRTGTRAFETFRRTSSSQALYIRCSHKQLSIKRLMTINFEAGRSRCQGVELKASWTLALYVGVGVVLT